MPNIHNVAYRPIAKQRLCKQRLLLRNVSINTFPFVRQQILNNETVGLQQCKRGLSAWSVRRSYLEDSWVHPVSSVRGVCEERTGAGGRGIAVVGAVVRKRLVTG
jgi:hypothetical protein